MVIKEYKLKSDIPIEDAVKIKKEIFFRQHPDLREDKEFKELLTIEVVKRDEKLSIIQFKIDE